jgi:hypothetical protein
MNLTLADWIRLAGIGQLCILIASSLVPLKLNWKKDLASLPTLHRQMYWTYGGYVVMSIIFLGLVSILCADELAAGSRLAKAFCIYGGLFWGVRLALQAVFDAKPHLTARWLKLGYHTLTVLFVFFTVVYVWVVVGYNIPKQAHLSNPFRISSASLLPRLAAC